METERIASARAFAPGHVTGLFAPDTAARDPRGRGSVGGGIVLDLGARATATFASGDRRERRVRDTAGGRLPITEEVVRRLAGDRDGRISVVVRHELPVGQGFGMSAAGALAAGLAVARLLGRTPGAAVETAHLAELFGGGGLGGVAAILHGGLEFRERAGIPPFGSVRHRDYSGPIYLAVTGDPIPSPPRLRDPAFLERVRAAAAGALPRLARGFDSETLLHESERFGDRLKLPPAELNRTIRRLRGRSVRVARAMFGRSFFALPRSEPAAQALERALQDESIPAVRLRAAVGGPAVRVGNGRPTPERSTARLLSEARPRRAP
ncbi:MAG: hypothetical protein ACREC5_03830 [Thermoplasmata archaeon]